MSFGRMHLPFQYDTHLQTNQITAIFDESLKAHPSICQNPVVFKRSEVRTAASGLWKHVISTDHKVDMAKSLKIWDGSATKAAAFDPGCVSSDNRSGAL